MICRIWEWNDEATIFSPSMFRIWDAIARKDCCFLRGTIFDRSFITIIRPGSFAVTCKENEKRTVNLHCNKPLWPQWVRTNVGGFVIDFASKETLLRMNGKKWPWHSTMIEEICAGSIRFIFSLARNSITTVREIRKYKERKDRGWVLLEDFHNFCSFYVRLIKINLTKPDWI